MCSLQFNETQAEPKEFSVFGLTLGRPPMESSSGLILTGKCLWSHSVRAYPTPPKKHQREPVALELTGKARPKKAPSGVFAPESVVRCFVYSTYKAYPSDGSPTYYSEYRSTPVLLYTGYILGVLHIRKRYRKKRINSKCKIPTT